MNIVEASDERLVVGQRWGTPIWDMKFTLDRENREIELKYRILGLTFRSQIPFAQVEAVKIAGHPRWNYVSIPGRGWRRLNYDVRYDLWLDLGEAGRLDIDQQRVPPNAQPSLAMMGRKMAEFMGKPFVNTSRD